MKTILLIDDDPHFRRLLAMELVERRYRALHAGSVAEADRLLKSEKVDLLVLDGVLPDSDGVSWLEQQRERGRRQPVIFVSAFRRDVQVEQRLRAAGVLCILRKPIDPDWVLEAIVDELDPMPALSAEAEEHIKQLRAEYGAQLPGKLQELRAAVVAACHRPEDPELLAEASRLAHRISGTAGSYGFVLVGEACGRVEAALRPMRDGDIDQRRMVMMAALELADAALPRTMER